MPTKKPSQYESAVLSGVAREYIESHFSTLHAIWVRQHLRVLCELRRQFRSDIDMPIIMGIIGQQMFAIDHPHEWDYAHAQDTEHHWDVARLTNVESIADASGIPRETVRRKVSILISKGWVRRTEKGGLFVTLDAVKALTPQTEAALDLQDVMFSALALGLVDDGKITVAPSIREIDSGGAGLDPPCSG